MIYTSIYSTNSAHYASTTLNVFRCLYCAQNYASIISRSQTMVITDWKIKKCTILLSHYFLFQLQNSQINNMSYLPFVYFLQQHDVVESVKVQTISVYESYIITFTFPSWSAMLTRPTKIHIINALKNLSTLQCNACDYQISSDVLGKSSGAEIFKV